MFGDAPELLQWNLSSRAKPESGAFDRDSLGNGQLVAVEGHTNRTDQQRLRWEELPKDVRFVTSPLARNYHRLFFVPPKQSQIASIVVNDCPIRTHTPGRQPYDPELLVHSVGHGDVLRPQGAEDASPEVRFAEPLEIQLPATITVELEAAASTGTCNLLFSQSLQDKRISASTNTSGVWAASSNVFVLGELASIALTREGCKAVRITVDSDSSLSSRTKDMARPSFGLLEAWVASGKTRLP